MLVWAEKRRLEIAGMAVVLRNPLCGLGKDDLQVAMGSVANALDAHPHAEWYPTRASWRTA